MSITWAPGIQAESKTDNQWLVNWMALSLGYLARMVLIELGILHGVLALLEPLHLLH